MKIPASGQFIKSFRVWQISKGPLLLCSLKIIQKFQSVNQPLMLSPMVYFMLYPSELIWFQRRLLVYNMADTWSRIYATTQQLSDSGTVCKLMIISWDIDALVRMPEGLVVREMCEYTRTSLHAVKWYLPAGEIHFLPAYAIITMETLKKWASFICFMHSSNNHILISLIWTIEKI